MVKLDYLFLMMQKIGEGKDLIREKEEVYYRILLIVSLKIFCIQERTRKVKV